MSALTIVDTDILIDAALQISEAVNCLDRIEQESTLAIGELFVRGQNSTLCQNPAPE